jgi:hypothetical protein
LPVPTSHTSHTQDRHTQGPSNTFYTLFSMFQGKGTFCGGYFSQWLLIAPPSRRRQVSHPVSGHGAPPSKDLSSICYSTHTH